MYLGVSPINRQSSFLLHIPAVQIGRFSAGSKASDAGLGTVSSLKLWMAIAR
ncbi:MAG: hypothetical protein AAGA67_01860 [Cyanobacteria bacterium P01_F01_bin.153]